MKTHYSFFVCFVLLLDTGRKEFAVSFKRHFFYMLVREKTRDEGEGRGCSSDAPLQLFIRLARSSSFSCKHIFVCVYICVPVRFPCFIAA
jgi:hypothetical protein